MLLLTPSQFRVRRFQRRFSCTACFPIADAPHHADTVLLAAAAAEQPGEGAHGAAGLGGGQRGRLPGTRPGAARYPRQTQALVRECADAAQAAAGAAKEAKEAAAAKSGSNGTLQPSDGSALPV